MFTFLLLPSQTYAWMTYLLGASVLICKIGPYNHLRTSSDFGGLNKIQHVDDLVPVLSGAIQEDFRCYYFHSMVWASCKNLIWILVHAEMELPGKRPWRCSKFFLHIVSLMILVYRSQGQVSPASHTPVGSGTGLGGERPVSTWTLSQLCYLLAG